MELAKRLHRAQGRHRIEQRIGRGEKVAACTGRAGE
jgi:hypothetical protein